MKDISAAIGRHALISTGQEHDSLVASIIDRRMRKNRCVSSSNSSSSAGSLASTTQNAYHQASAPHNTPAQNEHDRIDRINNETAEQPVHRDEPVARGSRGCAANQSGDTLRLLPRAEYSPRFFKDQELDETSFYVSGILDLLKREEAGHLPIDLVNLENMSTRGSDDEFEEDDDEDSIKVHKRRWRRIKDI